LLAAELLEVAPLVVAALLVVSVVDVVVVDAEVHPAHIMTLASNTIMIFFMQFLLSSLS